MRLPEAQIEALKTVRVLMQQEAQLGSCVAGCWDRKEHNVFQQSCRWVSGAIATLFQMEKRQSRLKRAKRTLLWSAIAPAKVCAVVRLPAVRTFYQLDDLWPTLQRWKSATPQQGVGKDKKSWRF